MKVRNELAPGAVIGRLTVIGKTGEKMGLHYAYEVICSCGTRKRVAAGNLKPGHTMSCGCLQRERRISHGMSRTAEYRIWKGILARCTNPERSGFANYGGRGIRVCDEWLSFEGFFADMGSRPSPAHSIDRVDVNAGYSKGNCRWALPETQSRNRRPSPSKTGVKGVHPMPCGTKFKASITVRDRTVHIGVFDSIEAASDARRRAELIHWGEQQ